LVDDRLAAVQQAEAKAQELLHSARKELTLGSLFDMYLKDVASAKTNHKQRVRAFELMRGFWGAHTLVKVLDERDAQRYVTERLAGRLAPPGASGETCRARTVEEDLSGLRACLNWALKLKHKDTGEFMLVVNPLRGFKIPRELNPQRPRLVAGEYAAILAAAATIDLRFEAALVLCYETGHRIASVRQLWWSDLDLTQRQFRWRSATQKNLREHYTPISDAALAVILKLTPRTGDVPVFESKRVPGSALGREVFVKWWTLAREQAGLTETTGAWHKLRREFATQLIGQPVRVVQELGGWADGQVLTQIYQTVSMESMREALSQRERVMET
jgi:integrase